MWLHPDPTPTTSERGLPLEMERKKKGGSGGREQGEVRREECEDDGPGRRPVEGGMQVGREADKQAIKITGALDTEYLMERLIVYALGGAFRAGCGLGINSVPSGLWPLVSGAKEDEDEDEDESLLFPCSGFPSGATKGAIDAFRARTSDATSAV
ncbi:MAG: hypothetical protein Q9167_004967 [Letrouitia subvulpina]